jgi:hypothetical protein
MVASPKTETPGELKLTLRKPIQEPTGELLGITVREPNVLQVERVRSLDPTAGALELLHATSGLLPSTLKGLSARDFKVAREWLLKVSAEKPIPNPLPDSLSVPVHGPLAERHGVFNLDLREPTAADLLHTDGKTGAASTLALISAITEIPVERLEHLPISVFAAADAYLVGFL